MESICGSRVRLCIGVDMLFVMMLFFFFLFDVLFVSLGIIAFAVLAVDFRRNVEFVRLFIVGGFGNFRFSYG